ncbi:MAG: (5-formylfuran-3-yl)methyl phosphate synthase [Pirellulales bacterium]
MTKLLVSVRNATEARIALVGGADLIDVKEPDRGPLGAADLATIDSVVAQVAGRVPLSAALGELEAGHRLDPSLAGRVGYAKFGLAGCLLASDWTLRWQAAIRSLPRQVTPVAVAYADWQAARAPDPWDVLSRARSVGCGAVLIDTFDKTAGPLGRHISPAALARFIAAARRARLVCVVAGRLGCQEIEEILPLAPDYVGVRGAACTGGRAGRLDVKCVRRLADLVHSWVPNYVAARSC